MAESTDPEHEQRDRRDIDSYLAAQPDDYREALQVIREAVRAAIPEAEEAIVYGVPGYRLAGKPLACYAGFKHHCGFYPMSPAVIRAHAPDLKDFEISKGTIRFQPGQPLPVRLVERLVRARAVELRKDA